MDLALERLGLAYNDGFVGRFHHTFSARHFRRTHQIRTAHYDNRASLPVFNLVKLHGSVAWTREGSGLGLSMDLKHVEELQGLSALARSVVPVAATSTLSELIAAAGGIAMSPETEEFVAAYHKRLAIVNPTKAKFRDTVMDQTYYDLLRLFTNQLEKENCVLIAAGFSFADEHLCELVCRACDSNPTMKLIVYAHTSRSKADLEAKLKTSQANIVVVAPPTDPGTGADAYRHNLEGLVHKVLRPALALMAGPADNDRSRP